MVRRSKTLRDTAETRYPWRVDIPVPKGGLLQRINAMHAWCREELEGEPWENHGRSGPRDAKGIPTQVSRFYFEDRAAAERFRVRWGGEISRTD